MPIILGVHSSQRAAVDQAVLNRSMIHLIVPITPPACTYAHSCISTLFWHLQGPSHLLAAPPSDVVIEDVTDAPEQVRSIWMFCYDLICTCSLHALYMNGTYVHPPDHACGMHSQQAIL